MNEVNKDNTFKLIAVVLSAVILYLYLAYPNDRVEFSKFNSNDSSEYLTLSKSLFEKGEYTRNVDGDYIPHKTWPPGMPLLLMPSVVFGDPVSQLISKYTIITLSLASLALIWLISYQFTQSIWFGAFLSAITALNPVYWELSRVLLPSIPVTFWCLASFYLILITFKSVTGLKYVFLVGLISGLGVLIQGTIIVLVALPIGCFIYNYFNLNKEKFIDLRRDITSYAVFVLGFLFFFIVWMVRNSQVPSEGLGFDGINQVAMIMAKEPANPSLGYLSIADVLNNVKNNIIWHLIYIIPENVVPFFNFTELRDVRFGNYIALLSSVFIILVSLLKWRVTLIFFAIIAPMIILLLPMSTGGTERYWVVISIFVAIAFYTSIFLIFKTKTTFLKNSAWIKVLCLPYFFIHAFLLHNHVLAFEVQPNNLKYNYPQFAQLVTFLQGYCETNKANISTRLNASAISVYTKCKAPKTNRFLNVEPTYSHVIIEENECRKSCESLGETIYSNQHWLFLKMPNQKSKAQIDSLTREVPLRPMELK